MTKKLNREEKLDLLQHLTTIGFFLLLIFSSCSASFFVTKRNPSSVNQSLRYNMTEKDYSQFAAALRPHMQDLNSSYRQACYLQRVKKHRHALQVLEELILTDPTYMKAYNAMGVSYDYLGDYRRAILAYKRALKLNPELAYVQNNLGYSYFLQGNLDAAIDAFKKAIHLDGENAKYHNNLGLVYSKKGLYDLALIEFELASDEAKAHYNIAKLYHREGRHQEAQIHLATASKLNPHITEKEVQSATASAEIPRPGGIQKERNIPPRSSFHVEIDQKGSKILRFKINSEQMQTQQIDEATINSDLPVKHNEPKLQDFSQGIIKENALKIFEVEVSNGNGVNLMARRVGNYLAHRGINVTRLTNAEHFNFAETKIYYHNDYINEAFDVSAHIPGYQHFKKAEDFGRPRIKIKVLIGKDIVPFEKLFRKSAKES